MEIIKYAGKNCVKCKALDRVLNQMKLDIKTRYVEDESEDAFELEGIRTLPTLKIINNEKVETIEGLTSPKIINEAIEKVR